MPRAPLHDDEIRVLHDGGIRQKEIAATLGIRTSTVSKAFERMGLRRPENTCLRGHPLTPENCLPLPGGKRQCKTCALEYGRVWKERRRRANGIRPRSEHKQVCPQGHVGMRRPGRYDCAECHREREERKRREKGVRARSSDVCVRGHARVARRGGKGCAECHREDASRRRAGSAGTVVRQVVWERDEGVCGICREPADRGDWHLDHVIPLSLGGEHSYANVQVAHPVCNLRKGARR